MLLIPLPRRPRLPAMQNYLAVVGKLKLVKKLRLVVVLAQMMMQYSRVFGSGVTMKQALIPQFPQYGMI